MKTPVIAALSAMLAGAALAAPAHTSAASARSSDQPPTPRLTNSRSTTVSLPGVEGTDRADLVRTADGVLHLSYIRFADPSVPTEVGPARMRVSHTAISPDGSLIRQGDVLGPWLGSYSIETSIDTTPTGALRIAFQGGPDVYSDVIWNKGGMNTAVSTDGTGAAWTVPAEKLSKSGFMDHLDSVVLPDGTPFSASSSVFGLVTRTGTITGDWQAAPPDTFVDDPDGFAYELQLAEVGDAVFAAYATLSNDPAQRGAFVQQVHPTIGARIAAPDGRNLSAAVSHSVAMAASSAGQLYVVHCTGDTDFACDDLALWNVTTGHVARVPQSAKATSVTLSAGPGGRMWVTWRSGYGQVSAVRSSHDGRDFGPVQVRQFDEAWGNFVNAVGEGSLGPLDLVLNNDQGHQLTRFDPALDLRVRPGQLRVGRTTTLRVRVTDAGDAVRGVRVRVAGRGCRTTAAGACRVTLTPRRAGRLAVVAKGAGYTRAKDVLRVRR